MNNNKNVIIIGGGLAGSEAAWQLAKRGVNVTLYEMRPKVFSPAHHTENLAELVCSNSLKATELTTSSGLLKYELELLNSLIIKAAKHSQIPAGGALAVDREKFSKYITDKIKSNKNITIINEEVKTVPKNTTVIIASGPLTSAALAENIKTTLGIENYLYFFDASSPIVTYESIDKNKSFAADRYDKGDGDYINCPMNEEEYYNLVNELVSAKRIPLKEFENNKVFEGCMPIEVMAKRGKETIRFGPLKPVGLTDPKTGKRPFAVVQLRKEDNFNNLYNLVGFQTNLTYSEQKRVFSMIPALARAEFVRYGVMHKNTYINAPKLLNSAFQVKNNPDIYIAGQLSGVEGYVESTMSGLIAALNVNNCINNKPALIFSPNTVIGAIIKYITSAASDNFQPMNANYGIINRLEATVKDEKLRKQLIAQRSIEEIKKIIEEI